MVADRPAPVDYDNYYGLLARDSLVGEPGLVLTPPPLAERTALDDGYLGASEVAQMRLAARMVVLSACNTGTGEGQGSASGLSGLARAFMAAGPGQVVASQHNVVQQLAAGESAARRTGQHQRGHQACFGEVDAAA